jgi:hypothetical protein
MLINYSKLFLPFILCSLLNLQNINSQPIDREALVQRHTVQLEKFDTLASLSVGNGQFAFTVDATGLQTFPDEYANGIPLGTQSEWGWHSFPNVHNYNYEDAFRTYYFNGRAVKYPIEWKDSDELTPEENKNKDFLRKVSYYYRQNPHRIHLANVGFEITMKDGHKATIADIKKVHQELNMWTGEIHSSFTIENVPVEVFTGCHQQQDVIGVKVKSALLKDGRIQVRVRLPYPVESYAAAWTDVGNNWSSSEKHTSLIKSQDKNSAIISHTLDTTNYFIKLRWDSNAELTQKETHYYLLTPSNTDNFELSCGFQEHNDTAALPTFTEIRKNSIDNWLSFWKSGGAVDFSGSTNKRAFELERRIITSQYLTKIQCAGHFPPQETGLTYSSWYGRPHMEMYWWHAVHFALWGRIEILEKSIGWYRIAYPEARRIAQRQGYDGVRWQKMTDNEGRDTPSSTGAFLIWQQPHLIYLAELCYSVHKDDATLKKYSDLVFATADFMVSYAYYDSTLQRYILGKGLIAAQERFKPSESYNPAFELAYWHWALSVAQKWRERIHLPQVEKWNEVLEHLSPLAVKDNKYLVAESAPDGFTNPVFRTDHPSVLGAYGMLPPSPSLDTAIMKNTFNWIWDHWTWSDTWGWDFPMTAMTATRLGMPERAIDALFMNIKTNTFLPNGHNYKDDRLPMYLPANGGLLTTIAMMCAGYDGNTITNPGFPKNQGWHVKWENLYPMP